MKSTFAQVIDILKRIWAYFPICALTDDMGFLTSNRDSPQHEYYFSVFNFLFGERVYQFLVFPLKQPDKKICLYKMKQLSRMENFRLSDQKEKRLKSNFEDHYQGLTEKERLIEKEELLRHLWDQQSRVETSYNKINAFTAIILAVIPIVVSLVDIEAIIALNILERFFLIILIYAYVNLCAWIFQAISVKTYMSSSFKDLKESDNKEKEQMWHIYYDWQQTKRKADMFVTYVIYMKVWIIAVIILTVVFCVGVPLIQYIFSDNIISL